MMGWGLLRALWTPIGKIVSVMKIFWPLIIYCILCGGYTIFIEGKKLHGTEQILWTAIFTILSLYAVILFVIGLNKWHRVVITGEKASPIYFYPKARDWKYILSWLLLGLLCSFISIVISYLFSYGIAPWITDYVANWNKLNTLILFTTLILIFSFGTIVLLFGGQFLKLPNISVEGRPIDISFLPTSQIIEWKIVLFIFFIIQSVLISVINILMFHLGYMAGRAGIPGQEGASSVALTMNIYIAIICVIIIYLSLALPSLLSVYYKRFFWDRRMTEYASHFPERPIR